LKVIKNAAKQAKNTKNKLVRKLVITNKPTKKIPRKKLVFITKTIKTTAPIMPIRQKLSLLLRPSTRKPKGRVLVVPPEQVAGVVVAKTASRSINLPQRYR
jgi:hypothetical protein